MKRLLAVFALATVSGMAADWTGYIIDQACSTKKEMRGNVACAQSCIKKGSPAVMVTDEGQIYKIADQDKVTEYAGLKVTITGKMDGDSIKVDSVKK
jgi:hypothetical protein